MALSGRAAAVTGAASGLGFAIAAALVEAGAAVCVADVNSDAGRAAAAELGRGGGRVVFCEADVADPGSAREMVGGVVREFGRIDVLVNNAGLQHVAPITGFPEERWQRLIGVLLTGTFLCTKYALPHMMRARWGRVVNIASALGLVANPYRAAYVAAKHGVVGFTKAAAWEAAEFGVTVNAICPGYIRTPMIERQILEQSRVSGVPSSEGVEQVMRERHAVKRMLAPSEVATLAVYLCSDAAAALTGAALPIDAGWTAR
jgi:3-hydroxybutyrate dehydrogenase